VPHSTSIVVVIVFGLECNTLSLTNAIPSFLLFLALRPPGAPSSRPGTCSTARGVLNPAERDQWVQVDCVAVRQLLRVAHHVHVTTQQCQHAREGAQRDERAWPVRTSTMCPSSISGDANSCSCASSPCRRQGRYCNVLWCHVLTSFQCSKHSATKNAHNRTDKSFPLNTFNKSKRPSWA
jgi:hypothetical protein